jgi:diguanylate cyclase (GGDEF)-like protein
MESTLDREGQRIGAQITAVLDSDLQLRASRPLDPLFLVWLQAVAYPDLRQQQPRIDGLGRDDLSDSASLGRALTGIAALATQDRTQSTLGLLGYAPFQFVVTPVVDEASTRVRAWILMGFPIQRELAAKLQDTLDVQLAVLSAPDQAPVQRVFDTLGTAVDWSGLRADGTETVSGDERLVIRQRTLPAVGGEVRLVWLRSHSAVMAPFQTLLGWLGLISLVGLALFTWASARSTRHITAPLRTLQQAAQALQQGRFDMTWVSPPGHDEVATLSRGFDAMRRSLSAQQAEIRRMAYQDRLTGLPNRQHFVQAVEAALQNATVHQPVAVLCLNLDRFKHVNEVLGYAFGDRLLGAVAQRLQEVAGGAEGLARLGGDEFGWLLTGPSPQQVEETARALLARLSAGVVLDGQRIDVRASIGVAYGPADAADADTLVNRAEMAMRWAKRHLAGVMAFTPALDTARADTLSLLSDLRQSLDRGDMQVHLQPKMGLTADGTPSAEALVRWQHPERGLIPPSAFIPFAEQTGFVTEMTRWVVVEVVRFCAAQRQAGQPCQIAVNVSARDLLDTQFAGWIAQCLQTHRVPACDLALEITESAIMDDPERAAATLHELSRLGVSLSIDDFGTGYSSLSYLKRLPVQALKIDQSFVRDMGQQANDAIIVRSTIDLAHSLGLHVVAEGVEDRETLDQLQAWGCDWAQGYHIAKPMPMGAFTTWLQQSAERRGVVS